MTNREIYQKTLSFSLRRALFDILAFLVLGALTFGGFLLMEKLSGEGLVGLVIGLLLGIVVVAVALRYVSFTYKAGQIAMMTRAITEGELPEDVVAEGKRTVKERFTTIAAFFFITRAVSAIFRQLGRGLTALGSMVGGETGSNVADAINSAIQVVISYLCDCCLGWIFYRREQTTTKAACEGAVLFFKHGKTLLKNLGRVAGLGLASLVVIGGAFMGVFYAIFSSLPISGFEMIYRELVENVAENGSTLPGFITGPGSIVLVAAALAAVILWSILHSVFVRPFILVGVLRNYMESGMSEVPTEASFALLDEKSPRFRKLRAQGV